MADPALPSAKVEASKIFERDLRIVCAQHSQRRSTTRSREELRQRVIKLVRWLYANEGWVFDVQDGTKIDSADEVHVVVTFDRAAKQVTVNVVRKRGRVH